MVKKISAKISADTGMYNEAKPIDHVGTDGGYIPKPTQRPRPRKRQKKMSLRAARPRQMSLSLTAKRIWRLRPTSLAMKWTRLRMITVYSEGREKAAAPVLSIRKAGGEQLRQHVPGSRDIRGRPDNRAGRNHLSGPGSHQGTSAAYPGATREPRLRHPGRQYIRGLSGQHQGEYGSLSGRLVR